MKKILYCTDKSSKNFFSFPYPFKRTSKITDAYQRKYPLVIFDEAFLRKKKKPDMSRLTDKVCFVGFSANNRNNFRIAAKNGFFDFITAEDDKSLISFKLKRANQMAEHKERNERIKRKLINKEKEIDKILLIDPLTGCYNWRYFLHRARQELTRARRYMYSISFVSIDIDDLRQINEVYSVRIADSIVKGLVDILKKNLRKEDVLVRWKEDQFVIIFPYLSSRDCKKVCERIRDNVVTHKFTYGSIKLKIKVSVGAVSVPDDKLYTPRDVINATEKCIVLAKKKGGNCVVTFSRRQDTRPDKNKDEANVGELRDKIEKLNSLLTRDMLEMIYGFARAIEAKDFYTGKHVEYTASIAEKIARKLNLPVSDVEDVKRAAILHDLGKVGIKESILSKPGPLNSKERDIVQTHPWIATEILREIHSLRGSISAILYHHERYDGKGYPLGLRGDEIPLNARIVAIADVYQALISNRPYRKAYTKERALRIIRKETGKHFDPKIAKVFFDLVKNEKKY